jgi:hypothetical protein
VSRLAAYTSIGLIRSDDYDSVSNTGDNQDHCGNDMIGIT